MYILSCLCLGFVGLVCLVATFSPAFDDNLLQRIGMAVLCLGCTARVQSIWQAETVLHDWFLVHGGMAFIAAGAVLKAWHHSSTDPFEHTQPGRRRSDTRRHA